MAAASRRPLYHFAPDHGWMNDPNGLIRVAGQWHLFYQKSETPPDYRVIGWGHAVSEDLLIWRDLGMAIAPNAAGYAYSGSVTETHDGTGDLAALLTRHNPDSGLQTQELALSSDDGATWAACHGGPVLDEHLERFRDPFIVRHADGIWRMLLVKPIDWHDWRSGRSRIVQYLSADLRTWRSLGPIGPEGLEGELYEVPLLLRLRVENEPGAWRWVLVTSVVDRLGGGTTCRTICWIGDLYGDMFVVHHGPIPLDHGPDFYAATTFSGLPAGEVVMVGWLASWAYARRTPADAPLGGTQSIPRRLSLHREAGGTMALRQHPAADMAGLAAPRDGLSHTLKDGAPLEAATRSTSFSANFHIDFGAATSIEIALRVGERCRTMLLLERLSATMTLDRSVSGATDFDPGFAGAWSAPLAIVDGSTDLLVLVDSSSIEIFAADGSAVLTAQIYPDADADRIILIARGGDGARVMCEMAIFDHEAVHA